MKAGGGKNVGGEMRIGRYLRLGGGGGSRSKAASRMWMWDSVDVVE